MQNWLFFVFLHMPRITTLILLFFWIVQISAQDEVRLPADLRQHNLTTYNSSLFNAAFALDRNDPESVAVWTRWQWQSIDADPSTLYLNYTRPFKENSVLGAAFFQHNTGIFFNTGGVINYAHQIQFSESVKIALGFNLFGFVQKLADTRFQIDPSLPIPLPGSTNDFILQWAPGASISVERMTLSLASENLLDYNFRAKEANTPAADKIFMGMMSYDFPINLGSQKALLRPSLYLRTIPQQANQIGVLSMLRTKKYWGQLGYNNFYGVGIGGGGTFLKRFNLGAVFEFGTSASINSKDPSFEIVASYFLGNPDERDVTAVYEDEMLEETLLSSELEEEEKIKEELKKAEELANEEEPKDEDVEKQEVEEVKEEEPTTEEASKKEQRNAEKEAAAEEKRLKKEQDRIAKEEKEKLEDEAKEQAKLAKEEQAKIEQDLKEAKAIKDEEAKQAKLAEKQREELRKAEEKAAEREEELKREVETKEATQKREAEARADALSVATQRRQDSLAEIQKAANEATQQVATKKRLDSLATARKTQADAKAKELQRQQDSIAQAQAVVVEAEKEEVKPEAGEKYEEVQTEDGLEPGFYLIANVFGTKKYFDAFMADLTKRGLSPKSFLRSKNNYNYAYLERYDTMTEARKARDSKFSGRYNDKTWVFRVVSE